jgi:hypothetical protein
MSQDRSRLRAHGSTHLNLNVEMSRSIYVPLEFCQEFPHRPITRNRISDRHHGTERVFAVGPSMETATTVRLGAVLVLRIVKPIRTQIVKLD